MRINNEAQIAFTANRTAKNASQMEKSLVRLGSGLKIAKGSDNASGLAISETMRSQIRGISQAQRNMQDGLSLLETSNEGLTNVNGLLQRARELSVMAATDTLTDADRQVAQEELTNILSSINDTAKNLEFNTREILGDRAPIVFQVGANHGQTITVDTVDVRTTTLGIDTLSIETGDEANEAISKIDAAITTVGKHLTRIGAHMQGIESHLNNALVFENNLTRGLSILEDTDMASEMMNFLAVDIRQQADQLLIAQVNKNMQTVMNILTR